VSKFRENPHRILIYIL